LKAVEQHSGDSGDTLVGSAMLEAALTAARLAEPYPELLAAGSHLLGTATV
jgi:hypothetical protein